MPLPFLMKQLYAAKNSLLYRYIILNNIYNIIFYIIYIMRFIFLSITTLTPVKTQILNLYHGCFTGLSSTKFDLRNISILSKTCNLSLFSGSD